MDNLKFSFKEGIISSLKGVTVSIYSRNSICFKITMNTELIQFDTTTTFQYEMISYRLHHKKQVKVAKCDRALLRQRHIGTIDFR